MTTRFLFILLMIYSSIGEANLSCEKPEDVDRMVKEVYIQLYCSSAKNILECANFVGIQSEAGAALAANVARGISGTMDRVKGICKLKKTVWWLPFLRSEAHAETCTPDFKVASQEAEALLKESRQELYYGMNQQESEIREQMRRVRETAEYQRHKGAPDDWDDFTKMKKIDREYQRAIAQVDSYHMPRVVDSLEKLVEASDQSLRGQADSHLNKLKTAMANGGGQEAYRQMDELMDLYEIRRPYDRMYLNKSSNPLVAAVESANQERVFALGDYKRVAYQQLEKLPPPKGGGIIFLEYSPVEEYELEKLSRDMKNPRSPFGARPTVTPKPGDLPNLRETFFRDPGYTVLSSRYPMLMEEPRVFEEVEHLKNQSWRMTEMVAAYNAVQDTLRGAKHVFTSMEGAKKFFENFPRMPEESLLAASRQAIQEKFENLAGGKGWSLSAEGIKRFALQEAAAGGARLLVGRSYSVLAKAGVLIAGPIGTAVAFADTAHSVVGFVLPTSVNCSSPCSEYLNFDSECKANPVMNSKSQAFLKLKTEQQISEIKKCPAMCDQLQGLYAQASPTQQWQVQCSLSGDAKGFSLKSKDSSKSGLVTFSQAEPLRVRLDQVAGFGPAQEAYLDKNGQVSSVRLPKRGRNLAPSLMKARMSLKDPAHYHEVDAKDFNSHSTWYQREASGVPNFLKSIQYAAAEAGTCCEVLRGERSLDRVPGRKRCQDYGVRLPSAATRNNDLKALPAGESH